MSRIYTTRLLAMLIAAVFNLALQAQTISFGPFHDVGEKAQFNTHDIVWQKMGQNSSQHQSTTRVNAAQGSQWIDRIKNMPIYLEEFYETYGEKIKEVLNGENNWLSDPSKGNVSGDSTFYFTSIHVFKDSTNFEFSKDASAELILEMAQNLVKDAVNKNWNEANSFLRYLLCSLNYDFPEAFWTGNNFRWGYNTKWGYTADFSTGSGAVKYEQNLYLVLQNNDYDIRIEEYQTPQLVSAAVKEYNEKVQSVIDLCSKGNRYQQVVNLNDWLTMHNCYNSIISLDSTEPSIAWSPMSALQENSGDRAPLCEGYARAFKVLCDKLNIPCLLATGYAKTRPFSAEEPHMWNEVMMEDNNWYAVDVTWNDPVVKGVTKKVSGHENHSWLLLGLLDYVAEDFTFVQSHPNSFMYKIDEDLWDVSLESLCADYGYQPPQTTIMTIFTDERESATYSLSGQKVAKPDNGIYIQDRRKVITRRKY